MNKLCLIGLLFFLLTACTNNKSKTKILSQPKGAYEIVYEADKNGKAITGSLEKLIEYVNNGNQIRVGWKIGLKDRKTKKPIDMMHWSDGGFITVIKGHVFSQIKPINQQGPSLSEPPGVFLVDFMPNSWLAIIGTTGAMNQKFQMDGSYIDMMKRAFPDEKERNEEIRKMETMKVSTKWAVLKR